MKRFFAIVILFIFLLNVLGFYGVLVGLKATTGKNLSERLDSDMYDLGQTITFEIPLTMPYGVDSPEYERVDGEFEKDGEVYRLVKQRYYKDTLYIVCVKDEKSSHINKALADYVKTYAGQQDGQHKTTVQQVPIKDFVSTTVSVANEVIGWVREITPSVRLHTFIDSYSASIVHPPDNRA